MPKEIKVPYGLREDQPIHVSEVESGLQQDIKCINCGGNLIARKGSKLYIISPITKKPTVVGNLHFISGLNELSGIALNME